MRSCGEVMHTMRMHMTGAVWLRCIRSDGYWGSIHLRIDIKTLDTAVT